MSVKRQKVKTITLYKVTHIKKEQTQNNTRELSQVCNDIIGIFLHMYSYTDTSGDHLSRIVDATKKLSAV